MDDDIKKLYEQRQEHIVNNVMGTIVRDNVRRIENWENRLSFDEDETSCKVGEVYAAQIKDVGRIIYDEEKFSYTDTPLEFDNPSEQFTASLYTLFRLDGYILPEFSNKKLLSEKALVFTEVFSGEKFICINDTNISKQKIWECTDNGIALSISNVRKIDDALLKDIGQETLGRKDAVADLLSRKQNDALKKIESDKLKDKDDAFIMASAEDVIHNAKTKKLTK